MDPQPLRVALRPGDVVWSESVAARVAMVGRGSAVGVPLRGELAAVADEDVKGAVVRDLEGEITELAAGREEKR